MSDDLRRDRVEALVRRELSGAMTDAEREELALYADEDAEEVAAARTRSSAGELDGQWLARVVADNRIQRRESAPLVRVERSVGLALVAGGIVASVFAPVVGSACLLGGGGLLVWSMARTRWRSFQEDPYKDIKK